MRKLNICNPFCEDVGSIPIRGQTRNHYYSCLHPCEAILQHWNYFNDSTTPNIQNILIPPATGSILVQETQINYFHPFAILTFFHIFPRFIHEKNIINLTISERMYEKSFIQKMDWVDIIAKFILPYLLIIILLLLFSHFMKQKKIERMGREWTLMFWHIST